MASPWFRASAATFFGLGTATLLFATTSTPSNSSCASSSSTNNSSWFSIFSSSSSENTSSSSSSSDMLARTGAFNRLAFARAGAYCIPATGKKSATGEDGFYIARTGRSIGVADGVGGWAEQGVDPSIFTRKFMKYALEDAEALSPPVMSSTKENSGSNNDSSDVVVEEAASSKNNKRSSSSRYTSNAIMHSSFEKVLKDKLLGSCAAIFCSLEDDAPLVLKKEGTGESGANKRRSDAPTGPFGTLNVANVGDCGVCVLRQGMGIIFSSREQQRSFNFPFQLGPEGDTPAHATIADFCVAAGDVIVMGSDGVFDNVYPDMLPNLLMNQYRGSLPKNVDPSSNRIKLSDLPPLNCEAFAESIAKLAYQAGRDKEHLSPFSLRAKMVNVAYEGGKPDDITVVVGQILEVGEGAGGGDKNKGVESLDSPPYRLIEDFFDRHPLSKIKSKL